MAIELQHAPAAPIDVTPIGGHTHAAIAQTIDLDLLEIQVQAIKVHRQEVPAYGEVPMTVREIPSANVFLVNYVFVDLVLDNILGKMGRHNVDDVTLGNVDWFTDMYYRHRKNIEGIEDIGIDTFVALDSNLLGDPVGIARTKTILYAIDARIRGNIVRNEY